MKTITLEASTNTHTMTGVLESTQVETSILKLRTAPKSKVVHGEHGTIGIEKPNVLKYTQKERNPITKKLQNAWD